MQVAVMATPDLLPQGPALSLQCLQAAAILLQAGSPLPLSTGVPLDQTPQVPILSFQGLQGSRRMRQDNPARIAGPRHPCKDQTRTSINHIKVGSTKDARHDHTSSSAGKKLRDTGPTQTAG